VRDTWVLLQVIEGSGERNRGLFILKSRGMEHSNQVREFCLTSQGVQLRDVYLGPGGVLTGSGRIAQEALERAEALERGQDIERKRREIQRKKTLLKAQIAASTLEFQTEKEELERAIEREPLRREQIAETERSVARNRQSDELSEVSPTPYQTVSGS